MAIDSFKPLGNPVTKTQGLERVADVDPRLTRSHYFDSRLLTAEDLNRDQIYLDERLREVGQALGYGIVSGLNLNLDNSNGTLNLSAGLGVSRAGRVLELTRNLSINLAEARAEIAVLNEGRSRRIERALYMVALQYIEQGTDVAEVFPSDLGENRRFSYDVITEGVQLLLVRLPQPLANQNEILIRANLLREWMNDETAGGLLPEEGLALGVLAIANDKPLWLDNQLLRQSLRALAKPGDLQADLSRRYNTLLDDLISQRAISFANSDFAASDYFRWLPPVGRLPADALSPVSGRQGYFPEHFNIWIAPVRWSDVELVKAESMSLPLIDLNSREPADIIVMVPLSNGVYGTEAQKLERPANTAQALLPAQNLLRLRLFPVLQPHELDSDKDAWTAIWDLLDPASIFYIRRPLRAAETRLSGIVLAKGVPLNTGPAPTLPSPSDSGLFLDADAAVLQAYNLDLFLNMRPPVDDTAQEAATKIADSMDNDPGITKLIGQLLMRIERDYDPVIWQSLYNLMDVSDAPGANLKSLLELLLKKESRVLPTGQVVADGATDLKLEPSLAEQWKKIAEGN